MTRFEIVKGDITSQLVEAIVNAANGSLLGGGGVDGAIHRAAGPRLLEECRTLNGCSTGAAKITGGYDLAARFVIHTVGPIYGREDGREAELLASCYRECLALAESHGLKSVAFPSISTGVYGFPIEAAAAIATKTVKDIVERSPGAFERIVFVTFSDRDYRIYLDLEDKQS